MRKLALFLLLAFLSFPLVAGADSGLKRYLYLSTPDAAQEGGVGKGILVFDLDDGHRLVRRIEIPFKEGLRGFCGNAGRHAVYYTSTNRRLGAFDLETEKILWERTYDLGCDRACITPDGKKIYAPTGWWWKGTNSGFLVVNPDNGDLLKRLPAGPGAHNSIASLDGQFAYLGTETNLWVFRTGDDSLARNIGNVGESGVFPFTVDGRNRYAYVCLGKHVGFDVVDLRTGEVPHRVLAGGEPIAHRTHGAALTPDERELWISDQEGKRLFTFDAGQMPPKETGRIDLSQGGHGWVAFSLDGRYAWCHTPDVIDVRTRKIVATLKDEIGKPVCGSKFIEVHFRDGKVTAMGDQFGLGRAHLKVTSR
jgi:outer membrane protein assembly factor BamB